MSPELSSHASLVTPWMLPRLKMDAVDTTTPAAEQKAVKVNLDRLVDYMRLGVTGAFVSGQYVLTLGAPDAWPDDGAIARKEAMELALENAGIHSGVGLQLILGYALMRLAEDFTG